MKDYNFMIDGRNFFNQTIKKDLRTYDNIRKFAIDQGDDLDYLYFKKML